MTAAARRFQFGFRLPLTIMVIVAVCVTFPRLWIEIVRAPWPTRYLLLFAGACWLANPRVKLLSIAKPRPTPTFANHRVVLVIAIALLAYVTWADERWIGWAVPAPWPYPDFLLIQFHDWLDALQPAGPDSFKIHGEFYNVLRALRLVEVILITLIGLIVGLTTPWTLPRWFRRQFLLARHGAIEANRWYLRTTRPLTRLDEPCPEKTPAGKWPRIRRLLRWACCIEPIRPAP